MRHHARHHYLSIRALYMLRLENDVLLCLYVPPMTRNAEVFMRRGLCGTKKYVSQFLWMH
jgi:hypothetical protein